MKDLGSASGAHFPPEMLRFAQHDETPALVISRTEPRAMRHYYVYILCSRSGVLYVGVTNDLDRRVDEHKRGLIPGFTSRYRVNRLVWYETFPTALQAIECEKRIKGWTRAKKIALIESVNPQWRDLSEQAQPSAADLPVEEMRHAERQRSISKGE